MTVAFRAALGVAGATSGEAVTADSIAMIDSSTVTFGDSAQTISTGGTYTGLAISTGDGDPYCVDIDTTDKVIFEDCDFRFTNGEGVQANFTQADLEFRNCRFFGDYPTVDGTQVGHAIHMEEGLHLVIENSHFQRGRVYLPAHNSSGGSPIVASPTIRIRYNTVRNIESRIINSGAPSTTLGTLYQFVQINDGFTEGGNTEIAWNEIWNDPDDSYIEDCISISHVGGENGNPIHIHHNLINGAYGDTAIQTYSGGGIMLQDGSGHGEYVLAEHNVVLNSENYGLAIASGRFHEMRDNRCLRTGYAGDDSTVLTNSDAVGMYVWDQYSTPSFGDHVMADNYVAWWRQDEGSFNNYFVDAPSSTTESGNTGETTTAPTQADIEAEVVAFRQVAQNANVTIGATREAELVQSGLIAEWRFDDGSGQVLTDHTGNGNDGRLGDTTGSEASDPSWGDGGLEFSGSQYVHVPLDISAFSDITIGVVARDDRTSNTGTAIGVEFVAKLEYNASSDVILLYTNDGAWTSVSAADSPGEFVHVTGVHDEGTRRAIAVDGVVTESGSPSALAHTANDFLIGAHDDGGPTNFFIGTILYGYVYNRALTDSEIASNDSYIQGVIAEREA